MMFLITANFACWLHVFSRMARLQLYGKGRDTDAFVSLFSLPDYPFSFSCFFLPSNGSVVPSMLIKIDAEARIDQRQLVDFMNTTLKSGALGKYQVDPSSVQSTGTLQPFVLFVCFQLLFSCCVLIALFSLLCFLSKQTFSR